MLLVTGGGFRWRSQGEDYEQLPRYLVARALHRLHTEMREVPHFQGTEWSHFVCRMTEEGFG